MDEFRVVSEDDLVEWLDEQWEQILLDHVSEPDQEIDRFINSSTNSIRYAAFTQLLGKHADPTRDLLCLQRGGRDEQEGRWDPRGFCTRVVVPWMQRHQDVLGTSTDPYVNNPLRRPRLDEGLASLQRPDEWGELVGFLSDLQSKSDPTLTEEAVVRCLKSIARRLQEQTVTYQIPIRIGLDHLCMILEEYLKTSSGGLRPQIITAALMRTIGEAFSLFSEVESQGINEADTASGVPGDVMCYGGDGELALAVEVKGDELTLTQLTVTIGKARSSRVTNVLFATPGFADEDEEAIQTRIAEEFAQGANIYQSSIVSLTRNSFALLGEEWRVKFLREICTELDARSTQPSDRLAFNELLTN